ncbi:NAD(P)H-hydrate dehydratase [Patescibacteria group bacterium]|nr:NAD(P)H-hydrate dehydratase [Patescibacteria group bacterium]
MQIVDKSILKKLKKSDPSSHKGQNGRLLVIAGSEKYHGALLMSMQTASRIVDMIYVHSPDNTGLITKLKSEIAVFINIFSDELWETIRLVDVILIGPGLEETRANKKLVEKILKKYPEKKVVVDATAFWHLDPLLLHPNCVVTPHSREFENTFKCEPNADNVLKMAKYYQCVVALKGQYDYVSDGKDLYENKTGNVGMTKGGTGDVVAGIISSLLCTNDPLISALAGIYLAGFVGDKLFERVGTFYNAEDLITELCRVWKKEILI